MDTSRNSYGRELPRAAANLLDEWMRGLPFGRLPSETAMTTTGGMTKLAVTVDGEPMTVRAFLAACRQAEPEKVDALLHALDRRKSAIDPTRPYAVPDLVTPLDGPGLLNLLANRLRQGGPVPMRVSSIDTRAGGGEPLRDALLGMRNDRAHGAAMAREALGLGEMPDGQVASIVLDRLERAGVLERPDHGSDDERRNVADRVLTMERTRSGALSR